MRASTLTVLSAAAGAAHAQSSQCPDGVRIIVARGTGEDEGPGATGELAERVLERIPGSDFEGLDYPASMVDPFYTESAAEGGDELREEVRQFAEDCPDSKLVVIGYSQGAQVASNTFCGGGGSGFGNDDPLPQELVEDHVAAIVLFGDPSHVASASYNNGTSENNGIFPFDDVSACEALGDRIVAYCDTGDVYCDSGDDDDVHGAYIERYGDEVVDFIVDRYESDSGDAAATETVTTTAATTTVHSRRAESTTASATMTDDEAATTTTADEGEATESGDGEGAAAGLAPGALGLLGVLAMML